MRLAARVIDATLSIVGRRVKNLNLQSAWAKKTPLHEAAEANATQNVRLLLELGADAMIQDEHGCTPLLVACAKRHLGPMRELLRLPRRLQEQCPAPVEATDWYYQSHLHYSPVTLVLHDMRGGWMSLDHIRVALRLILKAKPDLEVKDAKGRSVLNRIIKDIRKGMLVDLLQAGADVNSQDKNGNASTHRLLEDNSRDLNMFKVLLEWGADLSIKNRGGKTATEMDTGLYRETWEEDFERAIADHRARLWKEQQQKAPEDMRRDAKTKSQELKK